MKKKFCLAISIICHVLRMLFRIFRFVFLLQVFEYKLVGPFKVWAFGFLTRRTWIVLYISYLDKAVLSSSQKFILGPQNILKGMWVEKNPKKRQKTWSGKFWRSLCRPISHQRIMGLSNFGFLLICDNLAIS